MSSNYQEFNVMKASGEHESPLFFFQDFEFSAKRVFFVKAKKNGDIRGKHAHKKCRQLIYVQQGSFLVKLELPNREVIYEKIVDNTKAILIEPYVWVTLTSCEENSIFSCICDMKYQEDDYIREGCNFFEKNDD